MAPSTDGGTIKHITVIGAGVIGLTTAIKIQEQPGYQVTIIADHFPTDTDRNPAHASQWAGAHHVSIAGTDEFQRAIDLETFQTMWELSADDGDAPECFMRIPQIEYYRDQRTSDTLKLLPGFKQLTPSQITTPNAISGLTYNSINTFVPLFIDYLLSRFLTAGGHTIRMHIQHIEQIVEGGLPLDFRGGGGEPTTTTTMKEDGAPDILHDSTSLPPDAIVICAGLGARTLGGVEDLTVYPARGQTVLVHAPWLDTCMSLSGGKTKDGDEGLWTYIIPRKNGDAILGGTYEADDWYPLPRPSTTTDILERTLELCSNLAPPSIHDSKDPHPELINSRERTVDDLRPLIISENVGFRPCRKGGVRLEVEWKTFGVGGNANGSKAKKIPVVHNYGHGGFGYIACFGSASVAFKLLEQAFEETSSSD